MPLAFDTPPQPGHASEVRTQAFAAGRFDPLKGAFGYLVHSGHANVTALEAIVA